MQFDSHHERRGSRRLKMGCKAKLKSRHTGETFYGECTDLSIDGMALRSAFVPQFGEWLDVVVLVGGVGALPGRPLEALVEVRRCNEIERGRLYEIGVHIVELKK